MTVPRYVGTAVLLVVIAAAVLGGLRVLGPRADERARKLDERRVNDLRTLSTAIDLYWTREQRLPGSLEELAGRPGPALSLRDPMSGAPYEFRTGAGDRYELCARFEQPSGSESSPAPADFWQHGAGRQCFPLEPRPVRR